MKKTLIALSLFASLVTINSCSKSKCNDASAPNYGGYGDCTDLTKSIVGNYTGTFSDSIVGVDQTNIPNQTVSVTKVDESHVQFTPADNSFYPFTAKVQSISGTDNYSFTISSGNYSGNSYQGFVLSSSGDHGAYNSGNKILTTGILITDNNGQTIEAFVGVKQ